MPKAAVFAFCVTGWLTTPSPLIRHAPANADLDAVIDVRAVLQQGFRDIDMNDLPALSAGERDARPDGLREGVLSRS